MEKQIFRSFTIKKDQMIRLYKKNLNCLEIDHSSLARRLSRTEYHRHLSWWGQHIKNTIKIQLVVCCLVKRFSMRSSRIFADSSFRVFLEFNSIYGVLFLRK